MTATQSHVTVAELISAGRAIKLWPKTIMTAITRNGIGLTNAQPVDLIPQVLLK